MFFMPNLPTGPRHDTEESFRLSPVLVRRIGGRLWEGLMICRTAGQQIEVNSNEISDVFRVLWPVSIARLPSFPTGIHGCFVCASV